MAVWQLQEAKAKFSEFVKLATVEGPQTVTLRGEETAVLLSSEDYRRLLSGSKDFVDLILAMPELPEDIAAELEASRRVEKSREIDL